MLTVLLVIAVVSGALIAGALWAIYGKFRGRVEGIVVAIAGGSLLLSLVLELIQPAMEKSSTTTAVLGVLAGAAIFASVDYLIDEKWGSESGGGMLAAITLDGIPENLALGVALIGAGAPEIAALAGSIMLSNLPEAASGARAMRDDRGFSKAKILGIWALTAAVLSACALLGNLFLERLTDDLLAFISCVAAGAVTASLTTEVLPQAHRQATHWAGFATAIGLVLALLLHGLGG